MLQYFFILWSQTSCSFVKKITLEVVINHHIIPLPGCGYSCVQLVDSLSSVFPCKYSFSLVVCFSEIIFASTVSYSTDCNIDCKHYPTTAAQSSSDITATVSTTANLKSMKSSFITHAFMSTFIYEWWDQ
jgi:hypothetical protein